MGERKHVVTYTDGACIGNPGPGGYGVILRFGAHCRELSAGYRKTTNNRMELLAAVVALQALKEPCRVTLHSDSRYLINMMVEGWPQRWAANRWRRANKERVLNVDLWSLLLQPCGRHETTFLWVKGHANQIDNERCDRLATQAAQRRDLLIDEGFENTTVASQDFIQLGLESLS